MCVINAVISYTICRCINNKFGDHCTEKKFGNHFTEKTFGDQNSFFGDHFAVKNFGDKKNTDPFVIIIIFLPESRMRNGPCDLSSFCSNFLRVKRKLKNKSK
jgi:hypothetical protein